MFASGTLQTTYSGPIVATGETMRRARNDARSMAGFAGQSRAYRQQTGGVGAGSRMGQYRAGIEADRRSADQFGRSQQAIFDALSSDADSRFEFESNQADEVNRLRALMLDRNRIDQTFNLTRRGDKFDSDLQRRRIDAEAYQAGKQRRSSFLSTLLDII
jgi:hypothetical protein